MNDETKFTSDPLPTQGGTYVAWKAEYYDETNKLAPDGWAAVPMRRTMDGIPGEAFSAPINAQIGMCSFAQANAIAWLHAAAVEAETGKSVQVRVVEYRVKYDIKCYRAVETEAA